MSLTKTQCLTAIAVVITVLLASGCQKESPQSLIASARSYGEKGDHKAAIIQLKNALQEQPNNAEARFLLGRASLEVGDAVSAQKEFERALENGQSPEVVAPLLARAIFEQGEAAKVVAQFGDRKLTDPAAEAALRTVVGQAQLQLRKPNEAAAAFAAAIALKPDYLPAQLGQVRLLALTGKAGEALQLTDKVIAANPKSAEALTLQADLRLASGDRAGAKASLEAAVGADRRFLPAQFALVQTLISEKQFDQAQSQLDQVRQDRLNDVRVQYFDAMIAFGKNDLPKARDLVAQILKRAPDYLPALVMAGAIELQGRQPSAAEIHLRRAIALSPQHAGARRLLVRTYLASNQPAKAMETVQPLLAQGRPVDAQLLLLAGETYLVNGDLKQASTYYTAASESGGQEAAARTRLGQIALATGDPDAGIRELEAASALEGAPPQADMALILGHIRKNDLNRALDTAKAFAKKYPNNPLSQQLLGAVYVARKDLVAARAAFSKALEINPAYLPAAINLARLDLNDKKPDEAKKRFEAILAKEPKNEQALLALGELMLRTGATKEEIGAVLDRAVAANPQSVPARLAVITFHLRNKDARAALASAQDAAASIRNDSRILAALAQAQEAAGETNQAVDTLNRLAAAEPSSAAPLVRLAALYAKRQDYAKTIETLRRAQKISPTDPSISRDLVLAYLLSGKTDEAIKEAKSLQGTPTQVAAGYSLEGDIYVSQQRWPQAERAYREALKAEPKSEALAVKLYSTLGRAGKTAEAEAMAKKWIAEHPKNTAFRAFLAERALAEKNYKVAAAQYQAMLAIEPDNVVALNNLAWASGQLGDPKAIGYAERAVQLAPSNALTLDTLGTLLVAKGEVAKGLELLTRATALAPDRNDIRLNYAKALVKAGRSDDARKELMTLQNASGDFNGKSEIPDLLKKL